MLLVPLVVPGFATLCSPELAFDLVSKVLRILPRDSVSSVDGALMGYDLKATPPVCVAAAAMFSVAMRDFGQDIPFDQDALSEHSRHTEEPQG